MADLLSSSDRQAFKDAIQDVTDTFFKVPIIIRKRSRSLSLFNEDVDDNSEFVDHNALGLWVPANTGDAGKAEREPWGSVDLSEGRLLFNYCDIDDLGLIKPDKTFDFNPNTDTIVSFGKEYEVEGSNLVGPNDDKFALIKIHFKNRINNG